jgi:micrococcal nuclease
VRFFKITTSRVLTHYLITLFLLPGILSFQKKENPVQKEKQYIPKSASLPNPLKAEVIGIQDGDTIELKFIFDGKKAGFRQGKPVRIRFLHINSPERGKQFYKIAKQYTSERCFHKIVTIKHTGEFDRYGRLLGEVVLPNGSVLNKELVKRGLAIHYKKYSKSIEYANLELDAQKKKIGIWSVQQSAFQSGI